MISEYITESTVPPVRQTYGADPTLHIDERYIVPRQGLGMHLSEINRDPIDCKINNNSILTLTDKKFAKNLFEVKFPENSVYPLSFITYLVFSSAPSSIFEFAPGQDMSQPPVHSNRSPCAYVSIDEQLTDSNLTRQYTISSEDTFTPNTFSEFGLPANKMFRVELLSRELCMIHHDDGYIKSCLTYPNPAIPDDICTFTPLDDGPYTDTHPQVFEYKIFSAKGYMTLTKVIDNGMRTVIQHKGTPQSGIVEEGQLQGTSTIGGADTAGWPRKSIIKIRRYPFRNLSQEMTYSIESMWVKYRKTWNDHNSMKIDSAQYRVFPLYNSAKHYTNTYQYLQNNYLVDSQYNNISSNLVDMNITPLKNQLTPDGGQAENSPHATGNWGEFCMDRTSFIRKNTDFRDYQKIFNGTSQIKGDDTMHLGYTSYADKIVLYSDQVTYFHMPNSMKPFTWMSINYRRVPEYPRNPETGDVEYPNPAQIFPVAVGEARDFNYEDFVGLIRGGAVCGSTPLGSDKIFKKRADYRFNTPWGDSGMVGNKDDSTFGTFLCSWLCNAPNDKFEEKYGPVWMDRYYDDSKYSEHQVMDKPANCQSDFLAAIDNDSSYIDVISQLTLERGVLYAYHHIGPKDNKRLIEAFSEYMYHEDLNDYTQQIAGDDIRIGNHTDGIYNIYSFNGSEYGKVPPPDPAYGDFRVSFWMSSEDWTKPFGHQIFGNYTNEGIAVVNDDVITPVLVIPDESRIIVTNTDGVILTDIPDTKYTDLSSSDDPTVSVTRNSPIGDMIVTASVQGYSTVTTFNINGVQMNTYTLSGGEPYGDKPPIIDITASLTDMFTLFEGTSAVGRLDFKTGDFFNITAGMFASADVSGLVYAGAPSFNGEYLMVDEFGLFNEKPVYMHQGDNGIRFMVFDGTRWYLTTSPARDAVDSTNEALFFLPDGHGVVAPDGDTPTSFYAEASPNISTDDVSLYYTEREPKPVYIAHPTDTNYKRILYQNRSLYVIAGGAACTSPPTRAGDSDNLYYTNNGSIYIQPLKTSQQTSLSGRCIIEGDSTIDINNIKVDNNSNLWVFYNNNNISKYNSDHDLIFNVSLSDQIYSSSTKNLSGSKIFDLVREFREDGEVSHHGVLFHQSPTSSGTDVFNISQTGKVTARPTIPTGISAGDSLPTVTDISGFDPINRLYSNDGNYLTFKFRAKNKFSPSDFVNLSKSFEVSDLAPGYHHFCFGFDANLKGTGYFYIDGVLANSERITTSRDLGKYGFTDVLSKESTFGATQSYNNTLLCTYLKQPGYYFSKGYDIKSIRVYDNNLFRSYVKALSREHAKHLDIEWNVPCGRRSHLDHVDKFHTHRLPGYKTNDYNINVISPSLSSREHRESVETIISEEVAGFQPVPGNVEIKWVQSK
jgi:hypothetical protein